MKLCKTLFIYGLIFVIFASLLLAYLFWRPLGQTASFDPAAPRTISSLHKAYADQFLIGGALDTVHLTNLNHPSLQIVKTHFNSITSANALKWERINPKPGLYTPELADAFVDFGVKHNLDMIGHTLFWHQQTPDWVFEDEAGNRASPALLLKRMRERVRYLANRYGDKISTWDVVNEAINGSGEIHQSNFVKILGEDFIEHAFRIAQEELPPNAKLLYNDFNMDKRSRYLKVATTILKLKFKGIRVDGVGFQGHWQLDHPNLRQAELALRTFGLMGVSVSITEFDLDLLGRNWYFQLSKEQREAVKKNNENNPYPDGTLPPEVAKQFEARYLELFQLFLDHSSIIDRVTFWGINDSDSWLNDWPVEGRTNYPFLFDRNNQPKPALTEILALSKMPGAIQIASDVQSP